MFNALTGANQYVGNWPGVTVEKKEGKIKGKKGNREEIFVTDLPGIYSLSPYTLEEIVSRDYLLKEKPDVILNLVDATNIERNLYLTTQLMETGVPVVVALNMADLLKKNEIQIDIRRLSTLLGCPVVKTSALKGIGLQEAIQEAVRCAKQEEQVLPKRIFSRDMESAIAKTEGLLQGIVEETKLRWYAVKLLERDGKVLEELSLDFQISRRIEQEAAFLEKKEDDDMESIITCLLYTSRCV